MLKTFRLDTQTPLESKCQLREFLIKSVHYTIFLRIVDFRKLKEIVTIIKKSSRGATLFSVNERVQKLRDILKTTKLDEKHNYAIKVDLLYLKY